MANILGAGIYSDIFFVAFKFPNLFRRIFGEGAFTQSFLPNFIASSKKGAFSVLILAIFSLILIALSLLVVAFSGAFTRLLAFGFDEYLIELAKPIVAIHFWYLLLVFWVTFFSALLQYKQHFWVSAYNTALLNIAMIGALLLARDKDEMQIVYFVSYGVLVGGVAQVCLHFYPLYRLGFLRLLVCGVGEVRLAFVSGKARGESRLESKKADASTKSKAKSSTDSGAKSELESKNTAQNAESNFAKSASSASSAESKKTDSSDLDSSLDSGILDSRAPNPTTPNPIRTAKSRRLAATIKSELATFFKKFFPAMLGSSTAQIASFIDTLLASFLASGSISYLYYANRIFQLPLAIFAIAISTALFPMVAKAIKAGEEQKAIAAMKRSFWFLLAMLSLCAVGGIMLSQQIIWLLYEHGKFARADTIETALVFCAYMVGLVPFGCARIFSLYLYSQNAQARAAKISAISLGVGVVFSLILMQFWGAVGLALAGSLSGFVLFWLTISSFGLNRFWDIMRAKKYAIYASLAVAAEVCILAAWLYLVEIPN